MPSDQQSTPWNLKPLVLVLTLVLGAVLLVGAGEADDPLYKALTDSRFKVRIQAAAALAERGDTSARPALERLLTDEVAMVRAAACDALMVLGDPEAIPAIERVTTDPDDAVRRRARLALRVIRGLSKADHPAAASGLVTIESPRDRSESGYQGVAEALHRGLEEERVRQGIALQALTRRYLLLSNVRSVVKREGSNETTVEAECDMTVAELPQRTLRLSTKVTAGAAVTGKPPGDAETQSLAHDAAYGAGVELFKEFASWALIQPPPSDKRPGRKRRRR